MQCQQIVDHHWQRHRKEFGMPSNGSSHYDTLQSTVRSLIRSCCQKMRCPTKEIAEWDRRSLSKSSRCAIICWTWSCTITIVPGRGNAARIDKGAEGTCIPCTITGTISMMSDWRINTSATDDVMPHHQHLSLLQTLRLLAELLAYYESTVRVMTQTWKSVLKNMKMFH